MNPPLKPDPDECAKIKRAYKAASLLRWSRGIFVRLSVLIGITVGVAWNWYRCAAVIATSYALNSVSLLFGKCPRCGRTWTGKDLEDFVCMQCRVNIGLGLRD